MAFDVAMNEWLTVMTSSPGPTPSAASATCRAVVQLDTAQAYEVRTASANSRSNAATSGPCVTHPERMARRAASASCSPIHGRAMGIIVLTATSVRLRVAQTRADRITDLLRVVLLVGNRRQPERRQRIGKVDRVGETRRAVRVRRRAMLAQ